MNRHMRSLCLFGAAMLAAQTAIAPAPAHAATAISAEEFTATSHIVHDSDGSSTAQIFTVPAFTRASGSWRRVDNALVPRPQALTDPVAFDVPGAFRPTHFGRTAASLVSIDAGSSSSVQLSPVGLTIGNPSLGAGGVLTYPHVAPGTDLTVSMSGPGVRTNLRLNSPLAPLVYHWQLLDPGHFLGAVANTVGGGFAFGTVFEGGVRLGLQPAFAYTVDTNHPEYVPGAEPGSATLAVTQTPTGYEIVESVNPHWLLGKSFPIVLDPNLTFFTNDPAGGMDTHIVDGAVANYNYSFASVFELGYGSGTDTSGSYRRALNRFNLSSIPSGAVVTDGRAMNWLVNNYQCCPTTPFTINVDAYEGGEAWDHNWATWNKRDQYNAWSGQRGGYIGSPIANHLIGYDPGSSTTCSAGLLCQWPITSTVQRWINGQLANNGILFKLQTETTRHAVMAMGSGENAQSAYWPYLQVTYNDPPPPPPPPPQTPPGAVQNVIASAGDGYAQMTCTPPQSSGSAPIDYYRITYSGQSVNAGSCQAWYSPAPNGVPVIFSVAAHNAVGYGPTTSSAQVTPLGPPLPPTSLSGFATSDGEVRLAWGAPASDGGVAIDRYDISGRDNSVSVGPGPESRSCGPACRDVRYTGLSPSHSYTFYVSAHNGIGSGYSAETTVDVPLDPCAPLDPLCSTRVAFPDLGCGFLLPAPQLGEVPTTGELLAAAKYVECMDAHRPTDKIAATSTAVGTPQLDAATERGADPYPSTPNTGPLVDIQSVQAQVPRLLEDELAVQEMPADYSARIKSVQDTTDVSLRHEIMAGIYAPSALDEELAILEEAYAYTAADRHSPSMIDSRVQIKGWDGIAVTAEAATANVRVVESRLFSDAPQTWESDEEQQYHLVLARANGEWRIVSLDAAATGGGAS